MIRLLLQDSGTARFLPAARTLRGSEMHLDTTTVAQTSKSAVSRVSQPADHSEQHACRLGRRRYSRFGNLRYEPYERPRVAVPIYARCPGQLSSELDGRAAAG